MTVLRQNLMPRSFGPAGSFPIPGFPSSHPQVRKMCWDKVIVRNALFKQQLGRQEMLEQLTMEGA